VKKMTKLKVCFVGDTFLPGYGASVDAFISCRMLEGKKAYGLDILWEKSDVKRLPFDTKWDGPDRRWYAVFSNPQDLLKSIWAIGEQLNNDHGEGRKCNPDIGIEKGALNFTKMCEYLRKNCDEINEISY
jgi:hypothetical protein